MEDARTWQGGSGRRRGAGPLAEAGHKKNSNKKKTTQNSCRHMLLEAFLQVLYILIFYFF